MAAIKPVLAVHARPARSRLQLRMPPRLRWEAQRLWRQLRAGSGGGGAVVEAPLQPFLRLADRRDEAG